MIEKKISFVVGDKNLEKNKIFNSNYQVNSENRVNQKWSLVKKIGKKKGLNINTYDLQKNADLYVIFDFNLWNLKIILKNFLFFRKQILFIQEPKCVNPKGWICSYLTAPFFFRVISWSKKVGFTNYNLINYLMPIFYKSEIKNPKKKIKKNLFLSIISGNKKSNHNKELYTLRKSIIFRNKNNPNFNFYGKGWDGTNFSLFKSFKGYAADKHEVIKKSKFYLCINNCDQAGYFTYDILLCFLYGTIPVYYPNDKLGIISNNSFIDLSQFKSNQEMIAFLKNLTPKKINFIKKNNFKYIEENGKKFTIEYFSQQFVKNIMDL